jgi:hypothetical protein
VVHIVAAGLLIVAISTPVRAQSEPPEAPAVRIPADPPSPEDTVRRFIQSYKARDMVVVREKYTTPIGRQMLDWMIAQRWFDDKLAPPIITERKSKGDRFEIVCVFKDKDGAAEKVAVIFFLQNGVMKFHDLFLFEMKGDRFNMFLSYIINSPVLAQIEFNWKNPGKFLGSVVQAVIDAEKVLRPMRKGAFASSSG